VHSLQIVKASFIITLLGIPNDKVGAKGVGDAHYFIGSGSLPYYIHFENKPSATAPAQTVTVTDQLDPSKFDLNTFSFGEVTIGGIRLSPAQNSTAFGADADLRPANNIIARVSASLDKGTGIIKWQFQSIDPGTNQPTTDPTAGFLPPNKTPPQGESSVMFTVRLKSGLTTNTQIANKARITFDTNSPLDTPVWKNTVDNTAPTSAVQSLPASVSYSFPVAWSGTDTGAGVGSYTIYVSDNGGAFQPWLQNTTSTAGVFTGQNGHTYRFYSIALDAVGNQETSKTQPEATTTVNAPSGNAIDDATFFVSQHYRDFLNREPDVPGFNFWVGQINSCNGNASCIDIKRQNVSAAYFLSREFQETGFYVIRLQRAAFGKVSQDASKRISYQQFLGASQIVGAGFVDGQAGADAILDQNKTNYAQLVVSGADFSAKYPTALSAAQFVAALYQTAGVQPSAQERQDAVTAFGTGDTTGRAAALRKVAESNSVKTAEFAPAFVLLQYFGYLRRNPTDAPDNSDAGYQFWLNKLNSFGGDYIKSEMVRSFILSQEYRKRFG
jgi:hypothetical protein